MENFEKISGYVNDINDCSRSITYSTEDLKQFLMGFLVNRDYDELYDCLDNILRTIESISDDSVKIGWLSEDIKSQLKNLKDSNN